MAEDSITLVNKSVACKNPEILEFMYPSFMVKDDIFYDYEHDIIYNGKPQKDLKGMLAHGTRNFICTAGAPDVDFDNRDIQIKVLYDKWNKVANAKALEMLSKDNMMDDEFWEYFKKYWVLGSSKLDKDDGPRIYDMYKVLGKSKHDICRCTLS